MRLALETGMRFSEVIGLVWERIDMSRGVIRLERTKSGRRREVPMRQAVYDLLAAMPEPREGRLWPDQGIRTAFENAVEAAGLEDFAKVSMTEKYAHLAPDHLRAEIARTERAVEPVVGTTGTTEDEDATQVVDFTRARRGSSEAEQLIRNQ